MDTILISQNPILITVAILLTIISSYTAFDVFSLFRFSERNKRFLFLGAAFSLGIGIWIMNFFGMLSIETQQSISFYIPLVVLSMILSIAFSGLGFYAVSHQELKFPNLLFGSFLVTLAFLSSHFISTYAINMTITYNPLIIAVSSLLIFGAFLFTIWVLFYAKNIFKRNHTWLKPLSALIVSIAIIQSHFLFNRALTITYIDSQPNQIFLSETFVFYLVLFVCIFVITGLIASSTIVGNRLASSNTYLKDIQAALDVSTVVAVTDAKGIITYVNDKFVEKSKYTREELLGNKHSILNSGYHPPEFFKDLWKTIGEGNVWKGEIRNKAKDGSYYWMDTTIIPFLNRKGKPYQYVAIRSDITDRKQAVDQLKSTLKELSDIKFALDQSSIVAFTDHRGIITSVNDKFCEISGFDREELIGQDHKILNSNYHTKQFFKNLWKTIGHGEVWKGEIRNKAKDGSYYWVDTTIIPFLDEQGKPYQYLSIRNDITERKKTEDMLHRQDKLAAVGQLAAGVAHEIRNPLTSMKGYTEFLRMDELNEQRLEFFDIILDEIERVNLIVEEFMLLAKPKNVKLENKNIVPIIRNTISLLEFEARKKQIYLKFESNTDDIHVICDENSLKQVFLNFIKNGMEAMPSGGDLIVTTTAEDGHVDISIRDTGVGIPADKLKKLGEPFFTTKKEGNGLGLMVSFKIIESHNGTVFIESEVGKGTTFNIQLPSQTA
ncbi:PAS domain S-box protein [Bacillus sp. Marseille-P3661]|uniref:PAS domain S-box protein n=1 Tax=Bacillus sp. Marseille-P3661 TaxID=1936234 RepID=UPI000C846B23|nr:PAS domain S-box protein [Bacillus sp. Marseille-P3661]